MVARASVTNVPIPLDDPIAKPRRAGKQAGEDPQEGHITDRWIDFLTQQGQQVSAGAQVIAESNLAAQSASLAATDLSNGTLAAGLYSLSYCLTVTRPATTSSSIAVAFDWISNGVTLSEAPAAVTGNTVTSRQSGTVIIRIDGASPVRYSTTYASVGATSMQYQLDVLLTRLSA